MITLYKVERDGDEIRLTEKANFKSIFGIKDIQGPITNVKGRKKAFEMLTISNNARGLHGKYLIMRDQLDFDIVADFITSHPNGDRSVQYMPYTRYLHDGTLLDELGIVVLTYKHYYWGDHKLMDLYYPVRKDNVTDALLSKLDDLSNKAEQSFFNDKHTKEKARKHNDSIWSKV